MIEAAVFDFDGVIIESVDCKTRAFARLFEHEGSDVVRRVIEYHHLHSGISRFEKFRYYYRELLGRPLSANKERELGEQFSKMVMAEVLNVPFVPGALETLRTLQGRLPLFVASGTPEGELGDIVMRRGLDGYFKGVFGSPAIKGDILKNILESVGCAQRPDAVVMVGDAISDLEAAARNRTRFVARIASIDSPLAGKHATEIRDLTGFADIMETARVPANYPDAE